MTKDLTPILASQIRKSLEDLSTASLLATRDCMQKQKIQNATTRFTAHTANTLAATRGDLAQVESARAWTSIVKNARAAFR